MNEIIGMLSFILGLLIDCTSLVLWIKRLRGNGPSGVPLISIVFYIIAMFLIDPKWSFWNRALFFICCLLFHILCQYVFVLLIDRLMNIHNKRKG